MTRFEGIETQNVAALLGEGDGGFEGMTRFEGIETPPLLVVSVV